MQYIDCEKYAQEILDEVKQMKHTKYFAIVSVGDNPASQSYIKGKIKDCEYCGIPYIHENINPELDDAKGSLERTLFMFGQKKDVAAIILQLPLPVGWDEEYFSNLIPIDKDVDGLVTGSSFVPCTPEGVMYVLGKEFGFRTNALSGKNALIIGRGKLVGRPLFDMLLGMNCTVTVAHSKTEHLVDMLGNFDIIVSAVGKPKLVDLKKCTKARVVIDVGVNRVDGKLCGDCYNFDDTVNESLLVTPVPKGIGLMTRAMLMKHVSETMKF